MLKSVLPLLFLVPFASTFASSAGISSCGAGTLAAYGSSYASPSLGCSIGVLDYSNFTYTALQNAPSASSIELTPSGNSSNGFSFSQVGGAPFTALGDVVQFAISYDIFIDPAPIIPGARNSLDPPAGNVTITEAFCNDSTFVPGFSLCAPGTSPEYMLTVTTASPTASVIFTPPATSTQQVQILFTLDGTDGLASFDSLDTDTTVATAAPEPASLLLVGGLLLAGGYRLKKQRKH